MAEAERRIAEAVKQKTTELNLAGLKLTKVPAALGSLRHLRGLYLNSNHLQKVPNELRGFRHLEALDLSVNLLREIPTWLGELRQLQHLVLSGNPIGKIPGSLGKLQELRTLYLSDNELNEIPATLGECTKLTELYLHGNPDIGIPREILGPTWVTVHFLHQGPPANPAEILNYYFRPKRPLLESKLILVGRGEVGKTSLINRLIHNTFGKEQQTDGIKITRWDVPLPHCPDQAHLNVWDFGGQEIMHATHQFFLTRRSLYLLVLSGRGGTEDQDAEYWLKLIESFGGASPVLVVLNKQHEHLFDVNQRQLQGKYPFIKGFIKTDCADRLGLDELQRRICEEINALPHLRDGFPAEWFEVKDKLPRTRKSFISFDEYRKACRRWKVKSEAEQNLLGRYLHDLGVMLNFREDARLYDTHVLKPQWVTEGIYTILNSALLAGQKGELRLRDLQRILPAKEYPVNMHGFVMDLMKKFELCFTFPDSDTHYLIPELLDIQEPEAASEFDPAKCLNFRYEYEVLPEGLLPRFIVRTHGLIEDEHRWRTGVILRFEEGRALVKADVVDKKVFIHVTGRAEARRRLLGIIRSDFERIHNDLKFKPTELVPLPSHPDFSVPYRKLQVLEEKGVANFTEVIGDEVIEVDVQQLLNGVDLEGKRRRESRREALAEMREESIRVFISYAHKDEQRFRLKLDPYLKIMQQQGLITAWHDRLIKPGAEWANVIDANLEQAKIILLLVSVDFMASDYCVEVELKRALERHEKGEARVIPIIIRDVNWRDALFAKLQALPKDGKPVDLWLKKDSAWRNVADGIEKVARELWKQKQARR
ncbi:MAG: leucine-rich repeat domain-containing protein [Acidobacteria bacterium]|nr:leucine-rich repeat domain-containing protein [Acidobacteriota bacterium]